MRGSNTIVTFAALLSLACGGGGGGSNNGGNNNNPTGPNQSCTASGTFTAVINGTAWCAIGTVSVNRGTNSFIGIASAGFAGSTAYSMVIGIGNATGPGTHSLNLGGGGDGSSIIIGGVTTGWGTAFNGGTGSVTITSLTSNRVVGTFSGVAIPSSGTAANLVITNGVFDITF